jgi:hypothetical protein
MPSKRNRYLVSLPRGVPPAGEVNIAFAVKIQGKGRLEYVGPIEEESARQIMQILAKRICSPEAEAVPGEPNAKAR